MPQNQTADSMGAALDVVAIVGRAYRVLVDALTLRPIWRVLVDVLGLRRRTAVEAEEDATLLVVVPHATAVAAALRAYNASAERADRGGAQGGIRMVTRRMGRPVATVRQQVEG